MDVGIAVWVGALVGLGVAGGASDVAVQAARISAAKANAGKKGLIQENYGAQPFL